MKKLMIGIIALLLCSVPVLAQNQQQPEETISVPKSMLSRDQLDALAQKNLQDKMTRYGNWVGVGHEIGVAVNESLSAVTNQANSFAQTPVGKWTVFIVIWKVIGHDLMGFLIGSLIIIIGLPLWIWSYRKFLPHRIVTKETYVDGRWFRRIQERQYQIVMSGDKYADGVDGYRIAHYAFLAVLVVVALATMFAGSP